jgi:hypothetical protein
MYVVGYIDWRLSPGKNKYGTCSTVLTSTGHELASWREGDSIARPIVMYLDRLNYAATGSVAIQTSSTAPLKGVTQPIKGTSAGKTHVKHKGVRVFGPKVIDVDVANKLKETVVSYSVEELRQAKLAMPKSRDNWELAEYIEFYKKHAPAANSGEESVEANMGQEEKEHAASDDVADTTSPPVAETAPGFDMCVRCHTSVDQNAPGDHCTDGEYMCNACIHIKPLRPGDFCWVVNKQYRGGEPNVLDPPGFIVRYSTVHQRDNAKARRFNTHWWRQEKAGSMKLVPADADRDKVGKGWVNAKYCRHEMRLIRVGQDMHVLSAVALVCAQDPVPLPSDPVEEKSEGHSEGEQAHKGRTEARRPTFEIPAKGEDMSDCGDATTVDCGELGYVSNPKKGVLYRFPKSNRNSDDVAFVRGKAHSHSPTSTNGKC